RQYVRFGERGQDIDSGRVEFTENAFGEVGPFLTFQQGDILFEYGIIFDGGLESEIEDRQLDDLSGKELVLSNRRVIITGSRIDTAANRLQLRLVSGGKSGSIPEGQTRTVFTGFSAVELGASLVSEGGTPKAIFTIDDRQTPPLAEGQRIVYEDGLSLSVLRIIPNEAADGRDLVVYVLGPMAITLEDLYRDDLFSPSVDLNGRTSLGSLVQLKGRAEGDTFFLESIKFRSQAIDDIFLTSGTPLSETRPEFSGTDIDYGGLSTVPTAQIRFHPASGGYALSFTNTKGQQYTIPLLNGENFQYGTEDSTLWYIEASGETDYQISERDYLVITSANTYKGTTAVVRYDSLDTANRQITFTDIGGGQRTVSYSPSDIAGQLGRGTLTLGSMSVLFTVGENGNLAVDLTNDGAIDSEESNIVTLGGAMLDLGSSQTPGSSATITLTTQRTKIQDATADESVQILLSNDNGDLDISIPTGQSTLRMRKAGDNLDQGLTVYGAFFELGKVSGDWSILTIEYPLTQRFAQVSVGN
ncbi:MAG TPA: hypothetical protein VJK52_01810, partial [Candidatus Nanoarchaeia archaeon]|nr:hypothetical protein [Candidatus Nanoarchaeia archaeon]